MIAAGGGDVQHPPRRTDPALVRRRGHFARCVHREIKQNRERANVGGVEPGALPDQPAPQIIEANLLRARFAERAVMEWPLVAQNGRSKLGHGQSADAENVQVGGLQHHHWRA